MSPDPTKSSTPRPRTPLGRGAPADAGAEAGTVSSGGELAERVKELNCLFEISRISQDPSLSCREVLQRITDCLPPAWACPDLACARITIGDAEYRTANFRRTPWVLTVPVAGPAGPLGTVEVGYLAEKPFLAEEERLLEAVAARVGQIVAQQRATEALRDSERILREVVDASPACIVVKDRAGRFVLANKAVAELYGTSPDAMIGRTDRDFARQRRLKAAEAEAFMAADREVVRSGRAEAISEEPFTRGGGELRWFQTIKTPIELAGRGRCLLGVAMDITERKRAEEALRESERKFRSYVESCPEGVFVTDADGRYLDVNPAACRMTGYDRAELLGMSIAEMVPAAAHPEAMRHFGRVKAEGSAGGEPVPFRRKDGARRWWSVDAVRLDDNRFLGFCRDVTDLKRAEEALRNAALERQTILDTQPQIVSLQNRDLEIVWPNRAACESAGMSRQDLIGRHCYETWEGSDGPCPDCPVAEAIAAGEPREVERQTPDGRRWHVRGAPVRNEAGEVVGAIEVTEDITRRHQLAEQLRQAQKMDAVGQLAGGVAHDFRNQLQVIAGFASMLRRRGLVAEEGRGDLEEVLAAAERSTRLTDQLLAFSRQEALRPERVVLRDAIRDLQRSLAPMFGEDTEVRVDLGRGPLCAEMDSVQLQQALINLCLNARDAMPTGGRLVIGADSADPDDVPVDAFEKAAPGKCVVISVRDSGAGMDERTRSRAFEPFFTTKDVGKGTGLGLAMVYGFVTQSGGAITCESEPGEGTTFRMYFPAAAAGPERGGGAGREVERLTRGAGRILLVEDDEAVRRLLGQELIEAGYEVLQSGRPVEALEVLRGEAGRVDVLVTDVVMPGMSGLDLAGKAAELRPDLKILYMSGYADDELRRRRLDGLRTDILEKPFGPEQLLAKLSEITRRPAAGDHA